ncbi:ClC family H(+)/Cl(-) exchange transporter [Companilactobacillus alimentarius]|uniref:ClC family H(+)/Cl(-) exchange transporter n=1 Tax=Companilactobacillus alimentarius DSM 20249 TaxID=1423720 RepID=A0A2K9HGN7_9LACO|nr:ClC family H(+)/Cl(-) exchange transporter [Companilactobacillus alimentarius]AUI71548.1 ClC family H(+)/Cl(-) exchange transporter [Companilactobacillus alimentarius DSM 20249]KRK78453.1 Chloride channel protein [Companilactobacillus alimentarius DSM 20249]MDT6953474.1 chloride channel protein [Companilactobacillus alimentarius]GEO44728.1 ATP synthase F0 subunit A [Companilactobacillus alimentarius]
MKVVITDNEKLRLTLEGVLVGIISGIVVSMFRWSIAQSLKIFQGLYVAARTNVLLLIGLVVAMIIVAVFVGYLLKGEPNISGSGIPQVEAQLGGEMHLKWWSILWKKFVGGIVSIGPGLFLGREGPSIQLGSAIGQGVGDLTHDNVGVNQRVLIASGAAAGLAAAFSAPIAGAMFVLEEVYHNFSPLVWVTSLASAVSANVVALYVFGLQPVLRVPYQYSLPIKYYWHLIVLGIILGIMGRLYQIVLLWMPSLYNKTRLPRFIHGIIPLILIIPIGMIAPNFIGGGNGIIINLDKYGTGLLLLLGLFALRFIYSMISYGSGLPGGIFLPILNLGAIIGAIYAICMNQLGLLPIAFESNLIIFAMAGYFACIGKAPFTAIILVTEMVGSLKHLMPLAVLSLVAYIVVDLLNGAPIYESLKERLNLNSDYLNRVSKFNDRLEVPIYEGSSIDGKYIRDIPFPKNILVIAVYRGERQLIPRGDTLIKAGDRIVFMVNAGQRAKISQKLKDLINGIN